MVICLYSHLPLAVGITAFGVAAKKLIFSDLSHAAKPEYRWLYTVTIVLYLIFVALIDEVTEREDEALRNDRCAIWRFVVAVVVLLIAFFGITLTQTQFVALIAPLFVIQVVIDLPWHAR